MNSTETIAALNQYIDEAATGRPQDVPFWINEGIEAFVKMRLKSIGISSNAGLESSQRIIDDLSEVVRYEVATAIAANVITYPTDCYELIPHTVRCVLTGVPSAEANSLYARSRTLNWYFINKKNPFTKPQYKEGRLIYIQQDNKIIIYPSLAYSTTYITYIKNWAVFTTSVPIELHAKTHREITRIAAYKYLTSINNYQAAAKLMEQTINE